jgi:hypothetical protein
MNNKTIIRISRKQVLDVTRLRYDANLTPDSRRQILQASIAAGLIDADSLDVTPLYFTLVNDDVDRLSRILTRGWTNIAATREKIAANDRVLIGLEQPDAEHHRGGYRKGAGREKHHASNAAKQRAYRAKSRALRNQTNFPNGDA